ncbi:MAG: hypothetical protein QOD93_2083, partial [Acetobacteraceae bacterium]|nr:hypothetical protein [Acetobacteraceae bacterium]
MWNCNVPSKSFRDIIRRFPSPLGQPPNQNLRRGRHLDHSNRKPPRRLGNNPARNVRHHNDAPRDVVNHVQGNAVTQPMRLPAQRERAPGERIFRNRLVVLATGVGRTRNDPPHEPEPRIAGQRQASHTENRILASATRPNHQNKHRPTPLTGRNLTLAWPRINPSGAAMDTIRLLRQPGPTHPSRIDSFRGDLSTLHFDLHPGQTLNQAITAPLVDAGFQSGTVTFKGTALNPFRYVMPGPADNASHVAYFTAPRAPPGTTRIEQANATFGWADGKPYIHCHATWIEPDGTRRGGHILPHETIVAEPGEATAWAFHTIRIDTQPDPETNFTLFQPSGTNIGRDLLARIKPNEDIIEALETVARAHGITNAVVRGSLGSLIGARFVDGRQVRDHATEVLVREGHIRNGKAALNLLVVDMQGWVHE